MRRLLFGGVIGLLVAGHVLAASPAENLIFIEAKPETTDLTINNMVLTSIKAEKWMRVTSEKFGRGDLVLISVPDGMDADKIAALAVMAKQTHDRVFVSRPDANELHGYAISPAPSEADAAAIQRELELMQAGAKGVPAVFSTIEVPTEVASPTPREK